MFSFYGLYAWNVFEDLCRRIYFPIEPISKDHLVLFYGAISSIARSVEPPQEHQLKKEELDLARHFCEDKFFQGVQNYEVMALPSRERVFALYLAVGFLVSKMVSKVDVRRGPCDLRLTFGIADDSCPE